MGDSRATDVASRAEAAGSAVAVRGGRGARLAVAARGRLLRAMSGDEGMSTVE